MHIGTSIIFKAEVINDLENWCMEDFYLEKSREKFPNAFSGSNMYAPEEQVENNLVLQLTKLSLGFVARVTED